MSRIFPESIFDVGGRKPPSASLDLPFPTSYGAPSPASASLGVPFPVSGGTPLTGPTTFVNRSLTHHYVACYDVGSRNSRISPQERLKNLRVGDLVFVRSQTPGLDGVSPDSLLKFSVPPGSTTVEMFNILQLNEWLHERSLMGGRYGKDNECYYKDASEVLRDVLFIGSVRNTVDTNGSLSMSQNDSSRMMNVVVSKKASILNVFPYLSLAGQDLWLIVKKVPCNSVLGRRKDRDGGSDADNSTPCKMRWIVLPWTSTESSRPSLHHLAYYEDNDRSDPKKLRFGTCVHVGKVAESTADVTNRNPESDKDFETVCESIVKLSDKQRVYVRNNLEVFIKV